MILVGLAFVAGVVTVLSPCVLPVLPLFAGAVSAGRGRRTGWILLGFASTFIGTAVVLASALASIGLTTSTARVWAAIILACAGVAVAVPSVASWTERTAMPVTVQAARWMPASDAVGPASGLLLGGLIGLTWAPCVGPIMAAVIATSALVGPTIDGVSIALAYIAGAIATIGVIIGTGRRVASRISHRTREGLRRSLGVAMCASAIMIVTGLDLPIQARLTSALSAGFTFDATVEGQAMSGSGITAGEADAGVDLTDVGPAPEFSGITEWINSAPLTMASLRGKVVLVHFWTFGCINCVHVQPYVKAWFDRYRDDGFVVVGVHTPELSYEREIANVRAAVVDSDVRFPVAFDPGFRTWQAYGNRAWPAFYFVDRDGHIRHTRSGEGDYDGSEAVIRALLAESG